MINHLQGGLIMKSKLFVFSIFFILFSLVACSPSEQAIQEALAQTQTAQSTNTNTPEPTATFTLEPSFTPTNTPTMTSTPDLRVITVDSKDLMLTKDDLPPEPKYYLPNQFWISPHHNSEVVSDWGFEEGTKYIEETGRIDGWWVTFQRGINTIRAPEQIYQNIIQYKTSEGAQLTMSIENPNVTVQYEIIDDNYELGDFTVILKYHEMQPSGEYRVTYLVETIYRNYQSRIVGWGWENHFELDYVIRVAEIALEKIKSAPLDNW